VRLDGATNKETTSTSAQVSGTLTEGAHTWAIVAEDAAGNSRTSATRTVNIDIANPVAAITAPTAGTVTGTVTIVGTATDANFASYTLDYGSGAAPGSWTDITTSSAPKSATTLGTLNTVALANGSYTIRLRATDAAAKTTTATVLVTVANDTAAPTTTLSSSPAAPDGNAGWFRSATTVTLTSNEPGTTYYKWDTGTYAVYTAPLSAPEGTHTIYFYSRDTELNTEGERSQAIKLDTAAPGTTPALLEPFNNIWISNQSPTFKWTAASDSGSGVARYRLVVDGVNNREVTVGVASATPLSPLSGGSHTWNIIAEDAAGNSASSSTWTTRIDATDPVAQITAPTANSTINGDIAITGTATDANFEKYVLEYGSGSSPSTWMLIQQGVTPVSNNALGSLDSSSWINGPYTMRLTVTDITGRTKAATVTVNTNNQDAFAPSDPRSLRAIALNDSQAYLSWAASTDNIGVVGYKVYRASDDSVVATTTQLYATLSSLTESTSHHFYVKAYDDAGNYSSKSNTVTATTFAKPVNVVQPNVKIPLGSNVFITFESLQAPGTASAIGLLSAPTAIPGNYVPVQGTLVDIMTSVNSQPGWIMVEIGYDKTNVSGDEGNLKLLHWNGTDWEEAASLLVDTQRSTVEGKVPSLSPFVVVEGGSAQQVAFGTNTDIVLMLALILCFTGAYLMIFRRPAYR
jgi:hypothetical protein